MPVVDLNQKELQPTSLTSHQIFEQLIKSIISEQACTKMAGKPDE